MYSTKYRFRLKVIINDSIQGTNNNRQTLLFEFVLQVKCFVIVLDSE